MYKDVQNPIIFWDIKFGMVDMTIGDINLGMVDIICRKINYYVMV
jgi:hypothetical protein